MSGPSPPRLVDKDEVEQTITGAVGRETQGRLLTMREVEEKLRVDCQRMKAGNDQLRTGSGVGLGSGPTLLGKWRR